jgi:hypothetical protein
MGLFTPAWKSKNEIRALRAVEKITDQNVFADIAKSDSDSDVREAAVEKLTDQSLLIDIAKNDSDWHVHKAAVEKQTIK